jgi:hypothetical protein
MNDDYGKKIGDALRAIRQMHSDTSKLLKDCDGTIGKGRVSIFGNNATRELTYSVAATQWMAEGVYRFYDAQDKEAGLLEGVTACFIDEATGIKISSPILIVGQIKYKMDGQASPKANCDPWDLWYGFLEWTEKKVFGEVHTPIATETEDTERIASMKLAAVPLYSVTSMKVVEELMTKVREAGNG